MRKRPNPKNPENQEIYALLEFTNNKPMLCFKNSLIIASKLDIDLNHTSNSCRLAFHGNILQINAKPKIYKLKSKTGVVDRLHEAEILIVKNMFKKETNLDVFNNLKIKLDSGETGKIVGPFGKSGKVKVEIDDELEIDTILRLECGIGEKQEDPIKVQLDFYKKLFCKNNTLHQF